MRKEEVEFEVEQGIRRRQTSSPINETACLNDFNTEKKMLSIIMTGVGAFLMALCGGYIGRHIEADLSIYAMAGFAVGIIWIAQAPAIALRKRVEQLEGRNSIIPADARTSRSSVAPERARL